MKILITTNGKNGLNDEVSERFARAENFTIVYVENNKINQSKTEAHDNKYVKEPSNAGVKAAEFAVSKKVDIVITGDIKENALTVLKKNNVNVEAGHAGETVSEVVNGCITPKMQKRTVEKIEAKKALAVETEAKPQTRSNKTTTAIIVVIIISIAAIIGYYLLIN